MDSRKDVLLNDVMTNKIVDVDAFLGEHDISLRTLQNDVTFLNSELGADILELGHSKLTISDLDLFINKFEKFKAKKTNPYAYKMTKEERLFIEFLIIINADNYVTASSLTERLFISKNTITSDLNSLKEQIQKEQLVLESKTNKGYRINGKEVNIRNKLYRTIMNSWYNYNDIYRNIIKETVAFGSDFSEVKSKLIEFFNKNEIILSDDVFTAFYFCMLFKISRLTNGHIIIEDTGSSDNRDLELMLASQDFIEKIFKLPKWQTKGELEDLGNLLRCFNLGTSIQDNYDADIQTKISSFVWEVCKELDILEELKYENYRKLCAHIISTVENIRKGASSRLNPIIDELKALYPDVFQAINKHIQAVEKITNRAWNENDISYIAMHIAVILETNSSIDGRLRAVLVCPNGRCVSEFLRSRLLNYFNLEMKETIPVYMLESLKDVDLVISTVPIDSDRLPVVIVSQILSPDDLVRIRKCIRSIAKKNYRIELQRNIESYVKGYQDILEKNADLHELEKLNKHYDKTKRPFFYNHLAENHILLDYPAKTWQEAVRKSGQLLKEEGYINQNYIDQMVRLVEENGPYILFMPGFALAHASPDDGAGRIGVSLVRLEHAIVFEGSKIPIKFILCLSITDKDSHISLMYQIYQCMTNEELFEKLLTAQTPKQMIELLRAFELLQEIDKN